MTWRHWFNIKAKPCLKRCPVPLKSTLCLSTNHCQYTLCCILTAAFHKQPNTADLSTGGMKRMVTSKYHSVNVLVSRPTFCVLLKKYMLLTHDKVCIFTADKCKTLHEVSYFDIVLYFCFNSLGVRSLANSSRARQFNPLKPTGVGWVNFFFFKVRVSIRICVPNLGAVHRERFLTIDIPLNPPGVGWVKFLIFFKERVSIRICVPNLGAVHRERFLTIDIPLNPPGVGWVKFLIFFKVRVSIRTCVPNLGAVCRKRFLTIDNPLNPPGVGWVKKLLR